MEVCGWFDANGRRNATIAQKTCVQVAAAALAEAGAKADVFAAAHELHDAALDLLYADTITKRDAHSTFRAKLCLEIKRESRQSHNRVRK